MESSLVETQKKLYGIGLEKGSCENQINLLLAQKEDLSKQEKACLEKEDALKRKIGVLKGQIAEKEDSLVEFSKRITETEANIKEFERSIQVAQERIKENDQGIRKREEDISRIEKEILTLQDQLDGITEDIVQQLDTRLKETGYSLKERKATEERLESLLKGMVIQIDGKIQMFRDGAVLKGLEKQELQNRLTAGADGLEELKKSVTALGENIETYKKVIPSFIDEFLAPEGIITKKREIDRQIEGARENISRNRKESEGLREENGNLRKKIDEYRTTLEDLRVNRIQLITQRKGMEEALQLLGRDLTAQEGAVVENQLDLENCRHRAGEVQKQVVQKEEERKNLISSEKTLQKELAELEKGISRKNKDLIAKEKLQKELTHKVSRVQEAVEKAQIQLASLNTDVRNLYENFVERHSRDLSEFESTMYEISGTSRDLRDSLAKVREEEKGLGSINLMAPEEFAEVKERHDFLQGQLEDLGKAREDLVKITNQIEKESTELFLDTYDKIKKSFHAMFRRLFGGGRAEIRLEDPDDVLNSGIEIFAQPPGKKLENITLLSGGEKSLTAIALLFATYMVKPSPFCILDEIDAAMDDQNIGRFTNLLLEFGSRSQFIIITHNKKTVTAAKTLLGVTMEESGVSKVVAVRLEGEGAEAEAVEV
jgi:chromosome segregation protein